MTDEEYTTAVDNGTYKNFITDSAGYGLCQWTYHSRKKKLYELAKAKNKSISDINVQLELLVSELKNMTGLYNTLKKATSVKQASDAFMVQFENPYDKSENAKSKRASYGMIYFNKYNNDNSNSQQGGNTPMGVKTYQETDRVQLSKNFNSYEFRCGLGRGCACTTILIDDKLVEYLQKIRDHFGKELQITSAYRCPNYNQSAGGATGSRHTKGQAADFVIKGVAPREVAKYAESIGILGIGLYETNADGHFVHIDTRDYKSFWYGQKQEKRTTFGGTSAPSAPKPSTPKPPVNTNLLMFGMKNDKVKELQEKLNKLNFNCGEPDGIFGADTKK